MTNVIRLSKSYNILYSILNIFLNLFLIITEKNLSFAEIFGYDKGYQNPLFSFSIIQ